MNTSLAPIKFFDWKKQASAADCLQALAAHRLLPVATLLAGRGLLRSDLVGPAEQWAAKYRDETNARGEVENEVFQALIRAEVPFLVLKGALLARTIYPSPDRRDRSDLDIWVPTKFVETAQNALRKIGFSPGVEVEGGPPMTQKQWVRRSDRPVHAVDLHWDLSNRPLLKNRFQFEALFERSIELPFAPKGARGLSAVDSLLHAVVHYYGHHQGEETPDQWLLDMDLLWRRLSDDAKVEAVAIAEELELASLLMAGLRSAGERFSTPVEQDFLDRLARISAGEPSGRLVRPMRSRVLGVLRNGLDEPTWRSSLAYLWRVAFPPPAHMRRKYPKKSRITLPWLYIKRWIESGK